MSQSTLRVLGIERKSAGETLIAITIRGLKCKEVQPIPTILKQSPPCRQKIRFLTYIGNLQPKWSFDHEVKSEYIYNASNWYSQQGLDCHHKEVADVFSFDPNDSISTASRRIDGCSICIKTTTQCGFHHDLVLGSIFDRKRRGYRHQFVFRRITSDDACCWSLVHVIE